MALEVFMPKLTHDMQAGLLVEWYKREGDEVQKGEPLFAVETDKATVEVEAEAAGVLRGLRFEPGNEVPVGAVMGWIAAPGEDVSLAGPLPKPATTPTPPRLLSRGVPAPPSRAGAVSLTEASGIPSPQAGGRIVASPLAKRLAREHGVDLRQIEGRGPHGRITQADVQAHLDQLVEVPAPAAPPGEVPYDVVALSRLRQTTGERMSASVRTAPHFDLEVEVDMTEAGRWRAQYIEGTGAEVSYTTLLVKIVARALRKHPQVNAAFIDGQLRVYREVNVAVAMAVEEGLLTPVIRRADEMSLRQIQEVLTLLREKAEGLRFTPDELSGGTFTVSNLGMYGMDAFRAIINPPQAGILAVGRIVERPVGVAGQIALRPMVRMILSVDHRVLDGATAAPFLVGVRTLLENPYLLL